MTVVIEHHDLVLYDDVYEAICTYRVEPVHVPTQGGDSDVNYSRH
jgi:hypothetical protein